MGYNLVINGVYWGYNPLTNLLLTSLVASFFIGKKTSPSESTNRLEPQKLMLWVHVSPFPFLGVFSGEPAVRFPGKKKHPGEQHLCANPLRFECSGVGVARSKYAVVLERY